MPSGRTAYTLALVLLGSACSSASRVPANPVPLALEPPGPPPDSLDRGLPAVAPVQGPLRIRVVYPSASDTVDATDSSFMFGSVGTGEATLTINGAPVQVWPNGAWLAWVELPPDSIMGFQLVARTATDTAHLLYQAYRTPRFHPPDTPVWIDSASIVPQGRAWWPSGEYLPVTLRATAGAEVRIRLPGGATVPLVPDPRPADVPWGKRAFQRDSADLRQPVQWDRFAGVLRASRVGEDPGPLLGHPSPDTIAPPAQAVAAVSRSTTRARPDSSCPAGKSRALPGRCRASAVPVASVDTSGPVIEAILGGDTARVRWTLRLGLLDTLPVLAQLDDDTGGTGTTDSLTVGRARPGATYHWFFPTGTRVRVSGRIGDDLRVRLSGQAEAWVPAADAQPLPRGLPPLRATVGSSTLSPGGDRLTFRMPLTQRVPFAVEEGPNHLALRLYGTVGDVNWIQYGGTDPYVRSITWTQAASDEVVFRFELDGPVWGYRTRWEQHDLLFEIRRPPPIDRDRPLTGRLIVVDPGHPPLGATGPTGLREADANLAVALRLRQLLEKEGARVILTRTTDSVVDLWPRVKLADTLDAELLISIHNNGLPDGVDPFRNNGSSVYYNHPRSIPLAFAIQRALVARLGQRDLGIGRGDLALVRPTWMPAVLCEGLFMMVPDQEAALRSADGQRRYARAVVDGVVRFLEAVSFSRSR